MPDRLDPAERRAQVAHVLGVDPAHAGVDRVRDAVRAADVVGPHVGREPVAAWRWPGGSPRPRPRTASPPAPARRSPPGRPSCARRRRRSPSPAGSCRCSSCGGRSPPASTRAPSSRADCDVAEHALVVLGADQRAQLGARVGRVADADVARPLRHRVDDPLVEPLAAPAAASPAVQRWPFMVKICASAASTHSSGSASSNTTTGDLPPSSIEERLSVRRPGGDDRLAGGGLAGEADQVDPGMRGQRRAGGLAEAVHDVEHARRDSGLLEHAAPAASRSAATTRPA